MHANLDFRIRRNAPKVNCQTLLVLIRHSDSVLAPKEPGNRASSVFITPAPTPVKSTAIGRRSLPHMVTAHMRGMVGLCPTSGIRVRVLWQHRPMSRPSLPRPADRVVVVAGDNYDHRDRTATPSLLVERNPETVRLLWEQVTDWEPDSPEDAALMEPIRVSLAFLQQHSPVVTVGLKSTSATSEVWDNWDRKLRTAAVYDWLRERGIDLWS